MDSSQIKKILILLALMIAGCDSFKNSEPTVTEVGPPQEMPSFPTKKKVKRNIVKEERAPAATPHREKLEYIGIASPIDGDYTLQLMSSTHQPEAEKFMAKLDINNQPKFIMAIKFVEDTNTRYRVCVGVFKTKADAEKYNTELASKYPLVKALVKNLIK